MTKTVLHLDEKKRGGNINTNMYINLNEINLTGNSNKFR